jgi:Flp pilus assembly protein TadG
MTAPRSPARPRPQAGREPSSGLRHKLRKRLGRDRGSSAIELAILAPALLILTMMVVQWALWFQARQVALNLAQDGARYARAQQAGWETQTIIQTNTMYSEIGTKILTDVHVSVTPDGGAPNQVYVTVTGHVPTLLPGLSLSVNETSGGDTECFRPASNGGQQCG